MRRNDFYDLTDEAVAKLSSAEISRYIDLECALSGVPLTPEIAPVRPTPVERHPDVTVARIDQMYFASFDDARKVADLVNALARRKLSYVPGYHSQVVLPCDAVVTPHEERHYSNDQWSRERDAVTGYDRAEREYNEAKREYDEAAEKRERIGSSINERVEIVAHEARQRERLRSEYRRYIGLANGDAAIAARFLEAAHPSAREQLPEAFVGMEPAEPRQPASENLGMGVEAKGDALDVPF